MKYFLRLLTLRLGLIRLVESHGVVVDIEAGLLLRRADQSEWTAKVIPMRVVCDAGRMDRLDSVGKWSAYPSRPDTPVKVAWMCSLP